MRILTLGNDLLKQKAKRIEKIDGDTAALAKQMFEVLKIDKGVGLAGPQVGVMKRIFVVHIKDDVERVFVNPSILETSQKTCKFEEGCLSIPGVYADVVRSESIKIQAWNEKGKPFTLEADGLLARVIQHEYDHIEGVLFIERLSEFKRDKLVKQYEKISAKESK